MKIPNENRVDFFQDLFQKSRNKRGEAYERIGLNVDQYHGSRNIAPGQEFSVVRNITYELIESQVSTEIPSPKCEPKEWSERHGRNAKAVERLCASIRDELPFERMNDIDERETYVKGGDLFLVEWDESVRTEKSVGGVKVSLVSAEDFFPQPGVFEIDDMDWLIVRTHTTKEDIVAKYGITPAKAEKAEADEEDAAEEDIVTVYVCYYRGEDGEVSQYIWSGKTELANNKDYFKRKRYVCNKCGRRKPFNGGKKCDCGGEYVLEDDEYEVISEDITLDDGTVIPAKSPDMKRMVKTKVPKMNANGLPATVELDGHLVGDYTEEMRPAMVDTKIPWYVPKHYPVVMRKNVSRDGCTLGQSDCEVIYDHQVEINKIESRIHEKIMSGGAYPFKPEEVNFEIDNTVGEKVLNIPRECSARDFGVINTNAPIGVEQTQGDRLYDQAKRLLGISDSFQGQYDPSAKSGVAKQAQIAQASGRLQSKRVMKNAAYADIDRAIFELYLAFADEPRPVATENEYGTRDNVSFNRYDFVEWDEKAGKWFYDDQYLFSVDMSSALENNRAEMWQLNVQNLQAGVYGNPQDPVTLLRYWKMQEKMHYPFARANVEHFKSIVEAQKQAQAMQPTGNEVAR